MAGGREVSPSIRMRGSCRGSWWRGVKKGFAEIGKTGEGVCHLLRATCQHLILGFVYRVLDVWVDYLAHEDDLLLINRLYSV